MDDRTIEELICAELLPDDQSIALDFVGYLHKINAEFVRDVGYWKNKIYYLVKYRGECVCFIAIRDPDEPENRWTCWSDDMDSDFLGSYPLENDLKKIAWKHIGHCGSCGSCGGGRKKTVFGKVFDRVCGCTFRFDNPDVQTLLFMKKMADIRILEILHKMQSNSAGI